MRQIAKLAIAAMALSYTSAAFAQVVSIATPPQGSVWNTMASVMAGQAREKSNLKVVVQPMAGNEAMLQALNQGRAEFTLDDVNDVITASSGTGEWDEKLENLRIVARINPFPVGLYVKKADGIENVADLKGKSVPSGWDGFPLARSHIDGILAAAELTMDDVKGVPVPELIRGSDAFAAGNVDSAFFAVGGPKVAEVDASVGGVRFLKVDASDEALQRIQAVRPAFYFSQVDPAPFRVGVEDTMAFVTWDNVLVAGADVSDESVTKLLTTIADNQAAMAKAYPPLGAFAIERAYKAYPGVDYHPAAVAFFAERGIEQSQ
ncbi:MAG: TAXI family TRAP transporter solute-binding subunit [Pseudomonadota bacterium]